MGQVESDRGEQRKVLPADLVIVNGKIWTATTQNRRRTEAEPTALAVLSGRIVAVGSDAAMQERGGPGTRTVDAGGRRVIPGMTDSHAHLVSGGMQLHRVQLRHVRDRGEFVKAVEDVAKGKKPNEWILGGRWSTESWADATSPNRSWIDGATGDVPALLSRMDGHQALANSAALRLAGITKDGPPDPVGGDIQRDPKTQEPTGILKESAIELVEKYAPTPSEREMMEGLRAAMKLANSFGITSVHNMSDLEELEVFRSAHDGGSMSLRISAYLHVEDWGAHLDRVRNFPVKNDTLRVPGFKGYMDGSLGSRTAFMREPYADASPDAQYPRGQLSAFASDAAAFASMVAKVDAAKLQVAVHAIGDEAIHLLLNAYDAAAAANGARDSRHRVEHVQHVAPEDVGRFSRSGVVASMQPYHKSDDGRYAETALGSARLKSSYAFRDLAASGALLVFGSDFPVVTISPFEGIAAAVHSRTLDGVIWQPQQSLTLDEAMRAYTVAPPNAIHMEKSLGSLEVGKYADFAILTEDPFSATPEALSGVRSWKTFLEGREVYSAPASK